MSNTVPSFACIRHDEFNNWTNIVVSSNTMKLNLGKVGILALNVNYGEFKENSIEMNNNDNIAGIAGFGLRNSAFKCNSINALNNYSNPQYGMIFGIGANNNLSCNWTNRQQHGLFIASSFNDALIQGNSFNNHDIGLGLYYNPNIGLQYWKGNTWNGTFSQYGAYLSQIDQNLADVNRFIYDDTGPSNNHPQTTNDPGFDWFFANRDQKDFLCAEYDCKPVIPREEEINEGDEKIANSNPPGDPVERTSNYLSDEFLFNKLKENPDLLLGNPILQAFYNQQVNGSIGQFNQMSKDIKEAVKWESVYFLVYSTNETMLKNKNDSIGDLDSLLQINPGNSSIRSLIDQLNTDVKVLTESNKLIYETLKQITETRINNALYGNSSLPSAEAYEYNQGIVNEIYLSTVAKGVTTFTSGQLAQLIDIMEQCPYTGGPAMYTARSLYSMVDNTINWNDNAICALAGVLPRLRNPDGGGYSVYPNPSTGVITVNHSFDSDLKGYIEIYDLLGTKLSSKRLTPDTHSTQVDLSEYRQAIYFYKIIVNDQMVKNGWLSIVR